MAQTQLKDHYKKGKVAVAEQLVAEEDAKVKKEWLINKNIKILTIFMVFYLFTKSKLAPPNTKFKVNLLIKKVSNE